jgi:hypothetical protein
MAVSVPNPSKCEVRAAVIRFLYAKVETAAEIHRQLVSVYGEDDMNRKIVAKLCRELEAERGDVHDEQSQSFCLQIQRSRVRFPALPDFLRSSGSGTGST